MYVPYPHPTPTLPPPYPHPTPTLPPPYPHPTPTLPPPYPHPTPTLPPPYPHPTPTLPPPYPHPTPPYPPYSTPPHPPLSLIETKILHLPSSLRWLRGGVPGVLLLIKWIWPRGKDVHQRTTRSRYTFHLSFLYFLLCFFLLSLFFIILLICSLSLFRRATVCRPTRAATEGGIALSRRERPVPKTGDQRCEGVCQRATSSK